MVLEVRWPSFVPAASCIGLRHAGQVQRDRLRPANTRVESSAEEEWHEPRKRHIARRLLRDVVRSVPVGSGLLADLPPARGSAVHRHAAPAQDGPIHAHRHPPHGHRGTSFRGGPHQCSHSRCVQGSRKEDDLFGGSRVRRGTVILYPHHLLPQGPRHPLAAPRPAWPPPDAAG